MLGGKRSSGLHIAKSLYCQSGLVVRVNSSELDLY